jgi:hypothetical protein
MPVVDLTKTTEYQEWIQSLINGKYRDLIAEQYSDYDRDTIEWMVWHWENDD